MLDLYQRVVINRDVPKANLKAGGVAWLIDYVRHEAVSYFMLIH